VVCTQAEARAQADQILLTCIDLFVGIYIYVLWACIYIYIYLEDEERAAWCARRQGLLHRLIRSCLWV